MAVEEPPFVALENLTPQPTKGGPGLVWLYSLTLFLSALLLFSIQPIYARMLLPILGGAPGVWNSAMLFYQAVLLGGYAYAHFAGNRLSPKVHLISHSVLLLIPFAVLPFAVPKGSAPAGGENPVPWLLGTMLVAIGLPFFVVSSTGPLLQRWFSRTGHRASADPYFLYAASNLGSMLGLLGYPFLIEPNLRLVEQSGYWEVGYGVLVVLVLACAGSLLRSAWLEGKQVAEPVQATGNDASPTWGRRLRWIALAFVPSSLMLGVTQYITTDVAAVPLLWVIPLSLYLLTFTIVFARRPIVPHGLTLLMMPIALGLLTVIMALNVTKPLGPIVCIHLVAFFLCALLCHGEMAKDRPSVRYLTEFYLLMSVGGVLGGFFNAIVAPLVFPMVLEYPLAIAAAAALYPGSWDMKKTRVAVLDVLGPVAVVTFVMLALMWEREYGLTSSTQTRMMIIAAGTLMALLFMRRPLRFGLGILGMMAIGIWLWSDMRHILLLERSFFGVTRVERSARGSFTDIYHGTTLHGTQFTDPEQRKIATSYYAATGPIGIVLRHMHRPPGGKYAAVGLGAGTLTSYGKPGEKWTVYEIDPIIAKVARDPKYFTYLSDSQADVNIVLGDARLSLQAAPDTYDLIMLDAYSSDAVPVHLITKEALALYLKHLAPGGIIAFHISNKHLDLAPVLYELCRDAKLEARMFSDRAVGQEERLQRKVGSEWVMVYRPGMDFDAIATEGKWEKLKPAPGVGLWTDDFSSIWSIYNTARIAD